jgi:hypothetical protein
MTNAAPRFAIVRYIASYNDYDAIAGWYGSRIGVAHTKAWALALRDREDNDYDVYTEVREIATGKLVRREFAPVAYDDCPF